MATEVGSPSVDNTGNTGDVSISRTVTSGSAALTVQLNYYNGSGAVAPPTLNWNGTETFTLVHGQANGGGDYRSAIYFLANPTAGTHSVTGTFSGNHNFNAAVREWTNTTGTHDAAGAAGSGTTPSVNVLNVVAGEVILDAVIAGGQSGALTPGAGQSTTGSYNHQLVASIYAAASVDTTSTGTVTESWTISSSDWVIAAVALNHTSATHRAQVSFAELEVPNVPHRAQVSWAELEVPNVPHRAQVSWAELEVPNAPARAQVSWAEFEVPNGPARAQVSWAELEVPNAPARAQISWAEFQVPDVGGSILYCPSNLNGGLHELHGGKL